MYTFQDYTPSVGLDEPRSGTAPNRHYERLIFESTRGPSEIHCQKTFSVISLPLGNFSPHAIIISLSYVFVTLGST